MDNDKNNWVEITISLGYEDARFIDDTDPSESSMVINCQEKMTIKLPECELSNREMIRRALELWLSLLPDREW